MNYHVRFEDEVISIRYSVRTSDIVADGWEEIQAGGHFYYLSYEDLRSQGEGVFALDAKRIDVNQNPKKEIPNK